MSVDLREEALSPAALSEYAAIPIAFVVDRVLAAGLLDGGLGGMSLTQTAVTDPDVKDYDAIEDQVELVVHGSPGLDFQAGGGEAAVDQVGRYWIFLRHEAQCRIARVAGRDERSGLSGSDG